MRAKIFALCLCVPGVLAAACTTTPAESVASARQGVAELSVDTSFAGRDITRVVVEGADQTQELRRGELDQAFHGTLFLPAGPQVVLARAFAGDAEVGASNPVTVEIQPSVVTRVTLRILDSTNSAPMFGPILDSFSFPTTAQVGIPSTFTLAVVAPAGDPVTYDWSSTCGDAAFDAPHEPTTTWSKPAPGTCSVTVVATSNGIQLTQDFVIVVFPATVASGAVDVDGEYVSAPRLFLSISDGGLNCLGQPGVNASCGGSIASPKAVGFFVTVIDWANSTPGRVEISDSCGGRFNATGVVGNFLSGAWLPPVEGGVCFLTARAINGDGGDATVTVAALVRTGTPATSQVPRVVVDLQTGRFSCNFANNDPAAPANCVSGILGAQASAFARVDWRDGVPGSVVFSDDCGGTPDAPGSLTFSHSWIVAGAEGARCTLTVRATSLQGTEGAAYGAFTLNRF